MTRFAQLLYASFDDPAAGLAGGWQIKEASSDLSPEERAVALAHVVVRLAPGVAMSSFPTAEEIAARPMRLDYAWTPLGGVLTHAVHAGPDATGRPDNVFSHVVLDRGMPGERGPMVHDVAIRPIELWGWEGWRTPFGAAEVRLAALPQVPPAPAGVVDRAGVADFLFEPTVYRFGQLALLLDAVAAAVGGAGPAVVAIVDTATDAAFWIGAASFFVSPAVAAAMTFSTRATPADPDTTLPHLSATVLTAGAAPPAGDHAVVVDLRAAAAADDVDAGDAWHIGGGVLVAHTDLGRLALDACAEGIDALDMILADIDVVAADAGRPEQATIDWHLAVAMARRLDTALAHVAGARHLLGDGPSLALVGPDLVAGIEAALDAALGESAEDAWEAVSALHATGQRLAPAAQAAVRVYLGRALRDPVWLAAGAAVPLPVHHLADDGVPQLGDLLVAATVEPAYLAGPAAMGPASLGMLAVMAYIETVLGDAATPGAGVVDLAARVAEAVVDPVGGPGVAGGTAWPTALARLVWSPLRALVPATLPAGTRVWSGLTTVIGGWADDETLGHMVSERVAPDLLLEEIVLARALAGTTRLRVPAAAALWQSGPSSDRSPREWVTHVVTRLWGGRGWSTAEMTDAVRAAGDPSPEGLLSGVLDRLLTVDALGPGVGSQPDRVRLVTELITRDREGGRPVPDPVVVDRAVVALLAAEPDAWAGDPNRRTPQLAEFLAAADAVADTGDARAWPVLAPAVLASRALVEAAHAGSNPSGLRSRLRTWTSPGTGEQALRAVLDVLPAGAVQAASDLVHAAAAADASGDTTTGLLYAAVEYVAVEYVAVGGGGSRPPTWALGVPFAQGEATLGEAVAATALAGVARRDRLRLLEETVHSVEHRLDVPVGTVAMAAFAQVHAWADSLDEPRPGRSPLSRRWGRRP